MKHNFEKAPKRSAEDSLKYQQMLASNPQLSPSIIPFSIADMEFETAEPIRTRLANFANTQNLGYPAMSSAFCEAALNWQERRHHLELDKSMLVTTPGVVPALFCAVRAYTHENDGIIIMPPVYPPFYQAIKQNGRRVVENPLLQSDVASEDGAKLHYEINFEQLEELAADEHNSMLILCSPHNPMGRVWTPEELRRIADICFKHQVFIVADEIHNDLIFPGVEHTSFLRVVEAAEYQYCISCVSPSKSFNLAGLQMSCIFIPQSENKKRFSRELDLFGYHGLNSFAYEATIAAYNDCEDWLDELMELIQENYCVLDGFISHHLPELKMTKLDATYLAWIDCSSWGLDEEELKDFFEKEALIYPNFGRPFSSDYKSFVRLTLAMPTSELKAALERLVMAVQERKLGSFSSLN